MLSVVPPTRASCGIVVLAIASFHTGVVVAIPSEPVKKEVLVDVERSEETVRSEVVAMSDRPSDAEVMIEFAAKEVAPVPPLAIVFVNASKHVVPIA